MHCCSAQSPQEIVSGSEIVSVLDNNSSDVRIVIPMSELFRGTTPTQWESILTCARESLVKGNAFGLKPFVEPSR